MTPEKFAELKKQNFTHIPLVREVLADLDTPLSTFLKLANKPYSYLFPLTLPLLEEFLEF